MVKDIKERLQGCYHSARKAIDEVIEDDRAYKIEVKALTIAAKGREEVKWLPTLVVNIHLSNEGDFVEISTISHNTTKDVDLDVWDDVAKMLESITENALAKDDELMLRWQWGSEA